MAAVVWDTADVLTHIAVYLVTVTARSPKHSTALSEHSLLIREANKYRFGWGAESGIAIYTVDPNLEVGPNIRDS